MSAGSRLPAVTKVTMWISRVVPPGASWWLSAVTAGVAGEAQNVYRLQRAETRTGAGPFARYEPSSVSARRRACHPATNLSTSSAGMEKG